jgi:hypothetical protein
MAAAIIRGKTVVNNSKILFKCPCLEFLHQTNNLLSQLLPSIYTRSTVVANEQISLDSLAIVATIALPITDNHVQMLQTSISQPFHHGKICRVEFNNKRTKRQHISYSPFIVKLYVDQQTSIQTLINEKILLFRYFQPNPQFTSFPNFLRMNLVKKFPLAASLFTPTSTGFFPLLVPTLVGTVASEAIKHMLFLFLAIRIYPCQPHLGPQLFFTNQ